MTGWLTVALLLVLVVLRAVEVGAVWALVRKLSATVTRASETVERIRRRFPNG